MSYIPPHRRRQLETQQSLQSNATEQNLEPDPEHFTPEEIDRYYWPTGHDADHDSPATGKTLHASAATPDSLAYILLYRTANPRWDEDNIIFVKSSLNLLPPSADARASPDKHSITSKGSEARSEAPLDAKQGNDESGEKSIAVFKQASSRHKSAFAIEGCFVVDACDVLPPESEELARMLEQKFGREGFQRSAASWQASFKMPWAVVKMKKALVQTPPAIQRIPTKSVQELLGESRSRSLHFTQDSSSASSAS